MMRMMGRMRWKYEKDKREWWEGWKECERRMSNKDERE